MVGVHAAANTAQVVDMQAFWDAAAKQLVSNPVRVLHDPAKAKSAIPLAVQAARPQPASGVGLRGNELHKSFVHAAPLTPNTLEQLGQLNRSSSGIAQPFAFACVAASVRFFPAKRSVRVHFEQVKASHPTKGEMSGRAVILSAPIPSHPMTA
jgi:hypothetical protein